MNGQIPIAQLMEAKLRADFAPSRLSIQDDSAKHAGHAGHRPGGETHFTIEIESDAFRGQSRMACHRMVYASLEQWINAPVHALSVKTSST